MAKKIPINPTKYELCLCYTDLLKAETGALAREIRKIKQGEYPYLKNSHSKKVEQYLEAYKMGFEDGYCSLCKMKDICEVKK